VARRYGWNFPAGKRGRLRIRLRLAPDFAGALVGLTDHFSVAFDEQDRFFNIFNLDIGPGGTLAEGTKIAWHDGRISIQLGLRVAEAVRRGRGWASRCQAIHERDSPGPSYLRLRSTALGQDSGGLQVESVFVDVVLVGASNSSLLSSRKLYVQFETDREEGIGDAQFESC